MNFKYKFLQDFSHVQFIFATNNINLENKVLVNSYNKYLVLF